MISVYCRIFSKIALFLFATFFIIFFVVYGYRYNKNVWFLQKNVFIELKFWSDHSFITIWEDQFFASNKEVKLYNLDNGCYDIKYENKNYNICLSYNTSYYDVFVTSTWVHPLWADLPGIKCENLNYNTFSEHKIWEKYFTDEVQNAFVYNNIDFVQTDKWLFYCNQDYTICKYLTDVQWDIFCWNKNWLIYNFDWGYYLLWLR